MASQRIREMQRLLEQMKRNDIGGGYDLWDKQGAQHATPEERARIEAEAQEIFGKYDKAKEALMALIALDTDDVRAWKRAHEEYLKQVLARVAAKGEAESFAAEKAKDALAAWGEVRPGNLPYGTHYDPLEPDLYRTYFGIDPETLADV